MTNRIGGAFCAALLVLGPTAAHSRVEVPAAPSGEQEAVREAKALLEKGEASAAEKRLAGASSPAARWSRAVSIANQGRYTEAATIIRAVAKEPGGAVELQDSEGWILLAANWKAPPAALAAHARGFQLSHRGRCEEAKAALEEALRLAPGLADARYHLGFCLMKLGDPTGAERELRAAIAGYARTERVLQASAQYSLGNLLWEQGAGPAKEAVALLEKAMVPEGQGRRPAILLALAQARFAAGDVPGNLAALAETVEQLERGEEPTFPNEIAQKVRAKLWSNGCARRAPRAAVKAPLRCASSEAVNEAVRATEALEAGKGGESEKRGRAATRLDPTYGRAWFVLGQALLELDRPADAEPAFRKAREHSGWLDPRQAAGATALLARALIKRGSTSGEAVRLAAEASAAGRKPGDAADAGWYETLIGRAFAAAGNRACALERLRAAEAAKGAPEALRKRAAELIAETEAMAPGRPDCFEYQLYSLTLVAEFWRRYRTEHPRALVEGATHQSEFHPIERIRARVRFTGARRPPSPWVARVLTDAAGSPIGANFTWKELGRRYRQEAEVIEKGSARWVLVPEDLGGALAKELPAGGDADAYLVFVGVVDDVPMFLLTEFAAQGPSAG